MNEIACPRCRRPNRQGARYCATCGYELAVIRGQADDQMPTRPSGSSLGEDPIDLVAGERLLLCSDGLNGMLTDDEIQRVTMTEALPQAACDALIAAANEAGGGDNCSVIIIELKSP